MIPYEETKRGWDKAAATNANAAIHPAGLMGAEEYIESGKHDSLEVIRILNEVVPNINTFNSSIIDFGCGNGRLVNILTWHFKKVYAVDFSYAMLQQLERVEAIQPVLSVDNWFGLSEPADYAFSISVFIHNTYESGVQMMKAISENLKVGGIALLQIPIYDVATIGKSWTDVSTWTIIDFMKACKESGFEYLEIYANPGIFSFSNIGPNHHKFQVLKKIA